MMEIVIMSVFRWSLPSRGPEWLCYHSYLPARGPLGHFHGWANRPSKRVGSQASLGYPAHPFPLRLGGGGGLSTQNLEPADNHITRSP